MAAQQGMEVANFLGNQDDARNGFRDWLHVTSDSGVGSAISEAIQNLPTELRERRILKKHLTIKIREREAMG